MGQSKVLYAVGKAVCKPVFKLLYRYKTSRFRLWEA